MITLKRWHVVLAVLLDALVVLALVLAIIHEHRVNAARYDWAKRTAAYHGAILDHILQPDRYALPTELSAAIAAERAPPAAPCDPPAPE